MNLIIQQNRYTVIDYFVEGDENKIIELKNYMMGDKI